jgi:hypothetical protein
MSDIDAARVLIANAANARLKRFTAAFLEAHR